MVVVGCHLPPPSCRATVELWVNCEISAIAACQCPSCALCTGRCLQCALAGFSSMTSAHVGQKPLHLPEGGATATLGPHRPQCAAVHSVRYHFVHSATQLPTGLALLYRAVRWNCEHLCAATSPWELRIPCLTRKLFHSI